MVSIANDVEKKLYDEPREVDSLSVNGQHFEDEVTEDDECSLLNKDLDNPPNNNSKNRRWWVIVVSVLLFVGVCTGVLVHIKNHHMGTSIASEGNASAVPNDVPKKVLDFYKQHPYDSSVDVHMSVEEEDVQIANIESENERMMSFLDNAEDDEVDIQFMEIANKQEDAGEDIEEFEDDNDNYGTRHRNLQFHPDAACGLPMGPCSAITTTDRFLGVIPCNVCKVISTDMGTLDFPNGLLIQGKLEIQSTANVIIRTTHVFIEGELKVDLPNLGNEVIFRMYGTEDQYYTAGPVCATGCKMGSKAIAVFGGTVDITGYPSTCPGWEKLIAVFEFNGEIRTLFVSPAARACWTPGTELLITSHTRIDAGKQFAKVLSVDHATGLMTIDRPIQRPITILDNPTYAVEIASLTRRVKFEVDPAEAATTIGGHFIVHNTAAPQHLEGIEITNFGQQGILGRYPLHFHKCADSYGSLVSKNVIRDSNQRGYVIHNTNHVVLSGNVAVDVFGHCYFLEDGDEIFNNFIGNLGAGVKSMPSLSVQLLTQANAPKRESTDHLASTFWISNPQNFFIGNVAAGSAVHGYWFETLINEDAALIDESAAFKDLFAFVNNEVHSSSSTAFTVYPPGWRPAAENGHNLIVGLKVYRNNHWGAFLHVTHSLKFENCHFADNGELGVFINRGDSLIFDGCDFITKTPFAETYAACHLGMTGIRLHPSRLNEGVFNRDPAGKYKGATFVNSSFQKYSMVGAGCSYGNDEEFLPMQFGGQQVFQKTFDSPHSFNNVVFDDPSKKVDSCPIYMQHGIESVNIEIEADPSMSFSSSGQPGFLISPKWAAMLPAPEVCETYKDCGQYPGTGYNPGGLDFCPNVCLRTITIQTDPNTTFGAKLVVFDLVNIKLIYVDGYLRGGTSTFFDRLYTAVLPKGNYLFFFQNANFQNIDKAAIEANKPVKFNLEAAPACGNYLTEDDFIF